MMAVNFWTRLRISCGKLALLAKVLVRFIDRGRCLSAAVTRTGSGPGSAAP
jgi:hypothetical protein